METYNIRNQVKNYDALTAAAKKLIGYASTDDALQRPITTVDGVDLTAATEIVSDEYLNGQTDFQHYARMETRQIVAVVGGEKVTFFFAASGSPDGVWAEMSTNKKNSRFLDAFTRN